MNIPYELGVFAIRDIQDRESAHVVGLYVAAVEEGRGAVDLVSRDRLQANGFTE